MTDQQNTRVTTGKVRLSFPYLFKPRQPSAGQDGEPKYSTMLLIPKTDKKTIAALRAAEKTALVNGAATLGLQDTSKAVLGQRGLSPSIIKDADEDGTAEDYPERAGHYYMTVNAQVTFKPEVVDRNLQEIIDQSEVYSGVYARVSLNAFAYKRPEKKGISFGLGNVQILGGGESLAGGRPASADFEVVDEDEQEDSLL
jgi:hypothetical protein